jgi:uncharacterized damage-inducible protein DinB
MKRRFAAFVVLALPAMAQTTIKDAMVKHWKSSNELTIAVANAMPESGYTFRPNPEEMSFGELMVHIGLADRSACSIASGMTAPAMPDKIGVLAKDAAHKEEIDKASAMAFLTDTLGFCNKAVASVTLEQLDKVVGPASRNMTGYEWLWSYFTHTAHHRGQAEVYLRVRGITPPTYVF